ncbi:MAG: hypothetical protein INQ03_18235 [Candidatus Heimdallarchaeota archaeon]|nr:hypothetical protein [Candidatus Heimdallarchaeota archaeon]
MSTEGFMFEVQAVIEKLTDPQLKALNQKIIDVLKDSFDVHGISLFNFSGSQALIIGKNEEHFSNLKQTGEIVTQLQPKQFFSELPDEIQYRGVGHMPFDSFEIVFAKINEDLVIAFIVTDFHFQVFENTREIITSIEKTISGELEVQSEDKESEDEQKNDELLEDDNELKPPPSKYEDKFASSSRRVDPRSYLKPVGSRAQKEEKEEEVIEEPEEVESEDKQEEEKELKPPPSKYEDKFASSSRRVDPRSYLKPVGSREQKEEKEEEVIEESNEVESEDKQEEEKELKPPPSKYEDKFASSSRRVDPRSYLKPVGSSEQKEEKEEEVIEEPEEVESEDKQEEEKELKPPPSKYEDKFASSSRRVDPRSYLKPVGTNLQSENKAEGSGDNDQSIKKKYSSLHEIPEDEVDKILSEAKFGSKDEESTESSSINKDEQRPANTSEEGVEEYMDEKKLLEKRLRDLGLD